MLTSPAIEVQNLSHTYPAKRAAPARLALDGVSLSVKRGEVFGVLGPNGSGKSTLFNLLCGALAANADASVRMLGLDPVAQSAILRRKIGVVFQNPALDKKLTCRENLEFHGMLFGLSGAGLRQKSEHWLTRLGLADRANELADRLSGGMRRRLELAKALLPEPELLLMDEPAAGLDPNAVRQYWDILLELRAEMNLTIVLSTHHMGEADRCDRLLVLSGGKQVALGTPGELKAQIGGQVVSVEPMPEMTLGELEGALASALGVTPTLSGNLARFETGDPINAITRIARLLPGKFRQISAAEPGLDDVFLRLTGKPLGEDEALDLKVVKKKH